MGKRWIVLLVVGLVSVLATTVYAQPKMVIVLDPQKPGDVQCYRTENINAFKPTPMTQRCSDDIPINETRYESRGWVHRIRDRSHSDPEFRDHEIRGIQSGTMIWSNPCVTIWYNGRSYTVCN